MAEILNETYGVADAQRERRQKRRVLTGLAIVILTTVCYFQFRTHGQERIVTLFLQNLQDKHYPDAYKMWGENKRYPLETFVEDWGPTKFPNASDLKVANVDYCDTGVVFAITYPQQETVGLWVERATGIISFTPSDWLGRCPGRHLQFGALFHRLFSSGSAAAN